MNEYSKKMKLNHRVLMTHSSRVALWTWIAVGCLCFVQACHPQAVPTTKPTNVDDYQLTIRFEKSSVHVGEPVILSVSITNLTQNSLYWVESDPQRDFEILVRDMRGLPVPLTDYGKSALSEPQEFRRKMVKLDEKQERRYTLNVSKLYNLNMAGEYTLSVRLRVSAKKTAPTFDLTSNILKLTIL